MYVPVCISVLANMQAYLDSILCSVEAVAAALYPAKLSLAEVRYGSTRQAGRTGREGLAIDLTNTPYTTKVHKTPGAAETDLSRCLALKASLWSVFVIDQLIQRFPNDGG